MINFSALTSDRCESGIVTYSCSGRAKVILWYIGYPIRYLLSVCQYQCFNFDCITILRMVATYGLQTNFPFLVFSAVAHCHYLPNSAKKVFTDFATPRPRFRWPPSTINNFVALWLSNYPLINRTLIIHGVWKSQKKSHSTLRAKRATFTYQVDKS